MNKWSVKIKSVHNEIFIFDSSKMLKVKNKHFNIKKHEQIVVLSEATKSGALVFGM